MIPEAPTGASVQPVQIGVQEISSSPGTGMHEQVDSLPAADVVEVRHGRWIFDHMTGEWFYYSHCSECNHQEFFVNEDAEKRHKYCLNCGARMDKENETEILKKT